MPCSGHNHPAMCGIIPRCTPWVQPSCRCNSLGDAMWCRLRSSIYGSCLYQIGLSAALWPFLMNLHCLPLDSWKWSNEFDDINSVWEEWGIGDGLYQHIRYRPLSIASIQSTCFSRAYRQSPVWLPRSGKIHSNNPQRALLSILYLSF